MFSICTSFPAIQFSVVHRQKYLGKKKKKHNTRSQGALIYHRRKCGTLYNRSPLPTLRMGGATVGGETVKLRVSGAKSFSSLFQPRQWMATLSPSSVTDPCKNSEERKGVFLFRAIIQPKRRSNRELQFLLLTRPGPFIIVDKKTINQKNAFLHPFPSMRNLKHLVFCSCGWHKA